MIFALPKRGDAAAACNERREGQKEMALLSISHVCKNELVFAKRGEKCCSQVTDSLAQKQGVFTN